VDSKPRLYTDIAPVVTDHYVLQLLFNVVNWKTRVSDFTEWKDTSVRTISRLLDNFNKPVHAIQSALNKFKRKFATVLPQRTLLRQTHVAWGSGQRCTHLQDPTGSTTAMIQPFDLLQNCARRKPPPPPHPPTGPPRSLDVNPFTAAARYIHERFDGWVPYTIQGTPVLFSIMYC